MDHGLIDLIEALDSIEGFGDVVSNQKLTDHKINIHPKIVNERSILEAASQSPGVEINRDANPEAYAKNVAQLVIEEMKNLGVLFDKQKQL